MMYATAGEGGDPNRDGRRRDTETLYPGLGLASLEDLERDLFQTGAAESAARVQALAGLGRRVVWTTSAEGFARDMTAWSAYTGQTLEECDGWGWLDAVSTKDRLDVSRAWSNALISGESCTFEFRLRRGDGVYRPQRAHAAPVIMLDGSVREWIGACEDIDDRDVAVRAPAPVVSLPLEDTLDALPQPTWVIDETGLILYASPAQARMLGYTSAVLRGRDIFAFVHPDDELRVRRDHQNSINGDGEDVRLSTVRLLHRDGSWRTVESTTARFVYEGRCNTIVVQGHDVSPWVAAEERMHEQGRRLRDLLDHAPIGAYIVDEDDVFETVNDAYCIMYGYTREELVGRSLRLVEPLSRRDDDAPREDSNSLWSPRAVEYDVVTKDRCALTVLTTSRPLVGADGRVRRATYTIDITSRKQQEAHLSHAAHHDSLTGLPNRLYLQDSLARALAEARESESAAALLLIDLDHFKEINATLGHDHGDRLLQQVAERMSAVTRGSDLIARLGGDEFAVLLPTASEDGARQAAQRLSDALTTPIVLGERKVEVGASIGIALYPEHGEDAVTLLRHADVAMYEAKRSGLECALYDPEADRHDPAQLSLVAELRQGIARGDLRLHYQPVMTMNDGSLLNLEALVRWQHPEQGLLMPDQFIPMAERTGLIAPLTHWVLDSALAQCATWQAEGRRRGVAVNLSASILRDSAFPDAVAVLLGRYAVDPRTLTLEITESALMADPARTLDVLIRLSNLGVRLSVDDFGTGYSSLSHLKKLPVDEVKIDKSFVLNMLAHDRDASIVSFITALGRSLGLDVVAEGVEDRDTWDALNALGCSAAQGYYLSHPLPAGQVAQGLQGLSSLDLSGDGAAPAEPHGQGADDDANTTIA